MQGRLVIDHGVNVGSHTSSGPTSKTRGDTGATDEEMEKQQSSGNRHSSQWDGGIYSSKCRGFRICHNSDISKDSLAREDVLGVDGEGWTRWCVGLTGTFWILEVLRDDDVSKNHKNMSTHLIMTVDLIWHLKEDLFVLPP